MWNNNPDAQIDSPEISTIRDDENLANFKIDLIDSLLDWSLGQLVIKEVAERTLTFLLDSLRHVDIKLHHSLSEKSSAHSLSIINVGALNDLSQRILKVIIHFISSSNQQILSESILSPPTSSNRNDFNDLKMESVKNLVDLCGEICFNAKYSKDCQFLAGIALVSSLNMLIPLSEWFPIIFSRFKRKSSSTSLISLTPSQDSIRFMDTMSWWKNYITSVDLEFSILSLYRGILSNMERQRTVGQLPLTLHDTR